MSLQKFVVENRLELIRRTRAKVASRPSPQPTETEMEHGVPLFLSQLATALLAEGESERKEKGKDPSPNGNIVQSATLHGQDLRKYGFTIEQVVHDYGDVCQAVTELAEEQGAKITTGEFHTLNRCLDNAIAGAVASWSKGSGKSPARGVGGREVLRHQLLDLLGTASISFEALRAGRVGSGGATASILVRCLAEMKSILDDPKWASD
jgi:hypothetical protein